MTVSAGLSSSPSRNHFPSKSVAVDLKSTGSTNIWNPNKNSMLSFSLWYWTVFKTGN